MFSLTKYSLLSGSATFLSRITGFIRDIVTASLFGATIGYDAFILAFRIPNLLRRLFAEGAFSQAFVPVFATYIQQKQQSEIRVFISKIAGNLALILMLVTIAGITLAPWLIKLAAPGFNNLNSNLLADYSKITKFNNAVQILRIVFPYIFFISLTALAGGILNCYRQFLIPAITPVLLNLSLIFFALLLSNKFNPPELSLAWGGLVAGIVQLLFQLPFLYKLKLLPKLTVDWYDSGVKKLLIRMPPAILGAAISQINILIDSVFASFLTTGSITWLYYADRLMEFPLGIFGVSFASVILPQLATNFAGNNYQKFNITLFWGIKAAFLVGIPASLILFVLAKPIVSTLFLTGKFNNYDVIMTSNALMGYAFSVLGIILAKIFSSGFYAIGDLKTPVKVGAIILGLNIVCNMVVAKYLQHVGIAVATSIVSLVHAAILWTLLMRKKWIRIPASVATSFIIKIILAGILLSMFLYYYPASHDQWILWSTRCKILKLVEVLILGAVVYFSTLFICGFRLKNILISDGV